MMYRLSGCQSVSRSVSQSVSLNAQRTDRLGVSQSVLTSSDVHVVWESVSQSISKSVSRSASLNAQRTDRLGVSQSALMPKDVQVVCELSVILNAQQCTGCLADSQS